VTAPRLRRPARPRRVRWRYHFTDARSGVLLATLPMVDAQLSEALNGGSDGSGIIPLSRDVLRRDPFRATITRRSACWAERSELDPETGRAVLTEYPWGGLVMGRERSRSDRSLALQMVTWHSYWQRRLVEDRTFSQADRFAIMRTLLGWGVTQPGGFTPPHLAAITAGANLSGDPMDRTYEASSLKPILEAAKELSAAGDGFDWRLVPYRDTDPAATFRLRLDLGYPRLGRARPAELDSAWPLVWSDDENSTRAGYLQDYKIAEDGSSVNNRLTALGEGSGPTQIRSVVDAGDVGRDEVGQWGYLLYEGSLQSSTQDLKTQDSVDRHARGAMLAGLASEVQLTGVTVRGDLAPTLSAYTVGDDGEFRVSSTVTGQPTTIVGQIIARTIEPAQKGRTERVSMDVQGTAVA
jgi:hypothetical protein